MGNFFPRKPMPTAGSASPRAKNGLGIGTTTAIAGFGDSHPLASNVILSATVAGCHAHASANSRQFTKALDRSRGHVGLDERQTCPRERLGSSLKTRRMALAWAWHPPRC